MEISVGNILMTGVSENNMGLSMVNDFNNGAVAWTDWNILLDETGGPNHVGNFCFAPVHAKTKEGTLHYMNSLLLHRSFF